MKTLKRFLEAILNFFIGRNNEQGETEQRAITYSLRLIENKQISNARFHFEARKRFGVKTI